MISKILVILVVGCLLCSVASATTVKMNLTTMGSYGWGSVVTVDSSGRGGIYEKVGPYGGMPVGDGSFMFTEGSTGRATNPWSAITTNNFNGVWLSQITSLNIRTSGFEGGDANNFQPPHFILAFSTPAGNTRCAEWLPWTDGIARNPGSSVDAKFGTFNALTDGSWFCAWTGGYYTTWANMVAALGDCQIGGLPNAYGAAWRGQAFSVGFGVYDSSNAKYNSDARGLVDWFDVGVGGQTTTYYLNEVPEPASVLALVTGLIGFVGLRRKF